MKIVLVEDLNGQFQNEKTFEQATVKIGRDPAECQIVFEQGRWPMVSRRHAELRCREGRWLLVDTNSSFGTYINGQKIMEPWEVKQGSKIQFGAGGPTVLVLVADTAGASQSSQPGPTPPLASGFQTLRDVKVEKENKPERPLAKTHAPTSQQIPPALPQQPQRGTPKPEQGSVAAAVPLQNQTPSQNFPPQGSQPVLPSTQPQQQRPPQQASTPLQNNNASIPQLPQTPLPPSPSRTNQPEQAASSKTTAALELINASTGQLKRIAISKPFITIGRDPVNDIALDAAAAVVSRRHADIKAENGQYVLHDLGSFNGTLVNDQRITSPTPLYDNDRIQLGLGGPILRFSAPSRPAPAGASLTGQRAVDPAKAATPATNYLQPPEAGSVARPGMGTMIIKGGVPGIQKQIQQPSSDQLQLLMQLTFNGKQQLTIGRAPENDIHLDGLQISKFHAKLVQSGGTIYIEDAGSTNGVYVNGKRISGREQMAQNDVAQVGPFVFRCEQQNVMVFDTRSKTRIDAVNITKVVKNRSGNGKIKLLDDVDLTIQPNEFVGLLGPSGAGKSTLMDALNGMRPASAGKVLINDLDLYQHLDSLKQSIGYVPQDDIIHRELTVYRTLFYVAKLRLSRDVTSAEIDQIINEVMDVTGLAERRDVPVSQLSGGQRKRVSIAVELITKPSVIFLDEPTSGLDPATEEKIMRLFRQIAESGRTIILTTHAMENVKLFDKIVVLMRGKLVFYGTPQEALHHVKADSFKDLYDKLETPIDERLAKLGTLPLNASSQEKSQYKLQREMISEEVAEEWKQKFIKTEQYRRNILEPLSGLDRGTEVKPPSKQRQTLFGAIRQWFTLSRRYSEVLNRDKFNLFILYAQAPIIGLLTFLVTGANTPRDFPFFILAIVAIWFGTSVSSREIIRERAVYNRERMINLGLWPYVCSKLFNLSFVVGVQCILLFGTLKLLSIASLFVPAIGFSMPPPGSPLGLIDIAFGLGQLLIMILTGMVGVALGLLISSVVKTSEMATSLVPLILIPQILFAGLIGVPTGVSKVIGLAMPATWSFDEMKRLSRLEVLRDDGEGGLYKEIERANDKKVADAREQLEKFRTDANDELKRYEDEMKKYVQNVQSGNPGTQPKAPNVGAPPKIADAEKVPEDLSKYIDFKHPWMNLLISPLVLIFMFFGFVIMTVIALRLQDIG